jgi:hypothetical protein
LGAAPKSSRTSKADGRSYATRTRWSSDSATPSRPPWTEASLWLRLSARWISRPYASEEQAKDALAYLTRKDGPAGFWIHLDVDVLDDAIMPAVDYRVPDGLSWAELTGVLRVAAASDRALGLDVTIFNPTLDPDGRIAYALVDSRVAGIST